MQSAAQLDSSKDRGGCDRRNNTLSLRPSAAGRSTVVRGAHRFGQKLVSGLHFWQAPQLAAGQTEDPARGLPG